MTTGGCLCGQLRYGCDPTKVVTAFHCHCKDCQRVTGSGKATVAMFPQAAVDIQGEVKTFASRGTDGSHVTRGFCPHCGSQLFTFVEEIAGQVFIKAGTMDVSDWLEVNLNSAWLGPDPNVPGVPKNPPAD